MSDSATKWCIRFKLSSGFYTPKWIHRHGELIGREEAEEWAATQVNENEDYTEVDEIYPNEVEADE